MIWATAFVALVLGLAAVYLLLPRPRPYPPLWGAAAAAAAILVAGYALIHRAPTRGETVLFYGFAGIAILSGGLLITQQNPVRAALSFALVVLSTCGLFLLQAAPFLMAATIIVYAGAIIVTFLFVIMLAQQSGLSDADFRSREPLLSCIAGFVLLGALLYVLQMSGDLKAGGPVAAAPHDPGGLARLPAENVAYLGRILFTEYLLAVELAGTLLLVAAIGTIAITARRTREAR